MKSTEIVVGDETYIVQSFTASTGLKHLQKILKLAGPSLATFFSDASSEGAEGDLTVDSSAITGAVNLFVANLDKVDAAQLVQDLIKDSVLKNGQPVQFNTEFAANYGALIKVLTAVLTENYSSFFGESGLDLGSLAPLLPNSESE